MRECLRRSRPPIELLLLALMLGLAVKWMIESKYQIEPTLAVLAGSLALMARLWDAGPWIREQRSLRWDNERAEFFRTLSEPFYLQWQQEVVEKLYFGLNLVSLWGRRYSAAAFPASAEWKYPFAQLCKLALM